MKREVFKDKWELSLVRQNSDLKAAHPEIKLFQDLPDNDEPFDTEK